MELGLKPPSGEIVQAYYDSLLISGIPSMPSRLLPTREERTKMPLKFLHTDAKDMYLCKNGEILFKVEE